MKAMVFAAGVGSRLGEITKSTPKCLVEVGNKTMLEHVIERLKLAGVTSVVINLHHLADQIEGFVKDKNSFGIEITYSKESELLGTGGGLRKVKQYFSNGNPFIVHNSDIYSEIDLRGMCEAHKNSGAIATLAVMERETSRYLIFSSTGRLIGWENIGGPSRRVSNEAGTRFGFCGVQVLSPSIFSYMEGESPEFSIISSYMSAATTGEKVQSYNIGSKYWMDMGRPESLAALRRHLEDQK